MDALNDYQEWNKALWFHFFPNGKNGNDNPILNLDGTLIEELGSKNEINKDECQTYEQDFLKKCFMSKERLTSFSENWFSHTGDRINPPDCSSWERLVKGANRRKGLKDRHFIVEVDGAKKVIPAYFGMLCAILYLACTEGPAHRKIQDKASVYLEPEVIRPGEFIDDLLKSLHGDVNSFDADRMVCGTQRNISRMKFHAILKESERKDLIDFLEVNNLEWKDEPYNEYAVNKLVPALSRAGKQKFVELASGTLRPYNEGSIPYIKNILLSGLNFGKSSADSNNKIQVKDLKWRYDFWVDYNGNPHISIYPNGLIPFDIYYDENANKFGKRDDSSNTIIGYDDEIASDIQKLVEIPGGKIEHEGYTYYLDNISINNRGKWPRSLFFEQVDNNAFEQVECPLPGRNYIQLIKTKKTNQNPPVGWSLWDGCSLEGYTIYKSNGPIADSTRNAKITIKEKYPIEGAGRWFCIALPKGANDLYWRQNIPNNKLTKLKLIERKDGRFYFRIPVDRTPLNDANDFQHINGDLYFTEKDCNIENIIDQCINKETIKIDLCWNGTDEIYEIDGWGRAVSKDISSNSDNNFNPHGNFLKSGIPEEPSTEQNPLLEVLGDIADKNGCVHEGAMRNALNFVLKFFDIEPSPKKRRSLLYALRRLGYIVAYYDNEKGTYTNQLVAPYLELTNFSIEYTRNNTNAYLVKGIYQRDKLRMLICNATAKWFKRPFSTKDEVVHPEYKCLPDLVLLKIDEIQGWTTQSPAANTLIGRMENMGEIKNVFLNHGDVIRDEHPNQKMPCVEKCGNKKYLFDKDNNEIKRYGYYSIENGVYAPIPSSLLKLYCQNQKNQPVSICLKNKKNEFLYGSLAFLEGMAEPEIFRMALCDLNLGMAKEEQIFLLNRSNLKLPAQDDPSDPFTKMYTYDTNATKDNQDVILEGINKMCNGNIKDLSASSNRLLTIAEFIPLKRQKYQELYVLNDNSSLYYIESDYPMPDSLPENYTIVAFTIMKNNKRYLCVRKENDRHFVEIETDNMNQAISQLIEKRDHRDLCDNAKDYEGDVPSIDRPVKKVSIYKPINN